MNGFFVAAEFSLVAVERTTVERKAATGARRPRIVSGLLRRLSFHLSGAQLGITLTSLGLGFVAEPTLGELIEPALEPLVGESSRGFSIALALIIATAFQTVMGELVPKVIAIARPVPVVLAVAAPFRMVSLLMGPFVRVLDGTANAIVRRLGVEPAHELRAGRSLDELEFLVRSSGEEGTLAAEEVRILTRAIHFGAKTAADALTPRVEVSSVQPSTSLTELAELSVETGYSRFPVAGADLDDLRGVVLVKSIYDVPVAERSTTAVRAIADDALVVPEGRHLESILVEMRSSGSQLAVVVDEHGGTAGVLTVEDLVEEVVGDITDEHDAPELTVIQESGSVVVAASLHPYEVLEACGFVVPDGPYETLAGFALDRLQRIPVEGEIFTHDGWRLEVVEMDRLRIATIRLSAPGSGRWSVTAP